MRVEKRRKMASSGVLAISLARRGYPGTGSGRGGGRGGRGFCDAVLVMMETGVGVGTLGRFGELGMWDEVVSESLRRGYLGS